MLLEPTCRASMCPYTMLLTEVEDMEPDETRENIANEIVETNPGS